MYILICTVTILVVCKLYLIFIWKWKKNNQPFYRKAEELIIGHRGSPTFITENTIYSFQKALDQGVDGIELDIRLCGDGKIVIFHDADLIRLAERPEKIVELSFGELKKIPLKKRAEQKKEAFIPTLDDIIPLLKRIQVLNIEIKSEKFYENRDILTPLVEFIEKNSIQNKCIVSSFNPYLLFQLKKRHPKIILGFLYSSYKSLLYNLVWMFVCRPDNLHINYKEINYPLHWWARRKGLRINAYTVNDCETYHNLQGKIDGVFTDNIEYLK